jgi:hypothetical protein
MAVCPKWLAPSFYRFPAMSQGMLAIALIVNLLPHRPPRHWSHWIAAANPLYIAAIEIGIWREFHW